MRSFAGIVFTLFVVASTHAAPLELDRHGGAALGTTTLSLDGTANAPYLILFDLAEQQTVINPQVTLDISLTFATFAVQVPGFLGVMDGTGKAQTSFVLPSDPFTLGSTISLQAISGQPIDSASNLVRLTPALSGTFEPTLDNPSLPIVGGAVVENDDGSLLLVGGSGVATQTYDADLEDFDLGGVAFGVGLLGQSTTLADGRILFTGGLGLNGQPTIDSAVFDPVTGQTTTVSMLQPRAGHGASLMSNGKVLITGGFKVFTLTDILGFLSGIQGDTEIFDPTAMTFSAGPQMLEPRALHTSTAMPDGKVLVAGGLTIIPILSIPLVSNTAYAYNPTLGSFGFPIFFSGPRLLHSATVLKSGKVLLAGGLSVDLSQVIATGDITKLVIGTIDDCQLYKTGLFGGSFSTVNGLSVARAGAGIVGLEDGSALIAGGFNVTISTTALGLNALDSADIFTAAETLLPTGNLGSTRTLPIMHLLNDGTVLVAGGGPTTAEIYQP